METPEPGADTVGELDLARIDGWLRSRSIILTPTASATLITGGRSNLTYLIEDDGRSEDDSRHRYVLRRPPLGEVLPSAHDMRRESRTIEAVSGTGVPVPHCYGYCSDAGLIGAEFFVMDYVPGTVAATDSDGGRLAEDQRRHASEQAADVLARIHLLDVDSLGLGDLGRRDHYLARQLRRWLRQFHSSTSREVPLIDEVHRALTSRIPPQQHTGLVHGDYRMGNLILSPRGEVAAVLDWELATLGDSLADLGWLLATWKQPGEPELYQTPTGHPGFLTRDEMVHRYSLASGRDVSDVAYYISFALWRLACIYEGIYARYKSGAMADGQTDVEEQGAIVIRLVEAARAAM